MDHKIRAYEKYAYDIDTVKAGQKIAIICANGNCHRFLVMTVIYPSTMQCVHHIKGSFDMRNQEWYCHSHQ
jgi:hypothetical protein